MPDDVAHQLGREHEITEAPCIELFANVLAGLSGCPRIVREATGSDITGSGTSGTDDEQAGVVRRLFAIRQQSRHDPVAQVLQASDALVLLAALDAAGVRRDVGEDLPQFDQSLVGGASVAGDEAVTRSFQSPAARCGGTSTPEPPCGPTVAAATAAPPNGAGRPDA
ncbi:hypothetical protein [Streptomyces sp. NPDC001480]|uniref:hypothetical protein n=1 Tax=Streptomyces sp. NPDC001480 TaxID=3364577 RepID=UPI0036800E73